jgi:cell division protein FtsI/penicillin-binding protein 2
MYPANSVTIPLRSNPAEYIVNTRKKKKNVRQWIMLAIIFILVVFIGVLIHTISKLSRYQIISGKDYKMKYLYLSTFFYRYTCKKSFIYHRWYIS